MYTVSTTIVNVVQCKQTARVTTEAYTDHDPNTGNPVQYAWNRPAMDTIDADGNVVKGGKCIESRAFILSSCALSIFMDLIIIPIPSIMVWNLQMDRKTKTLVVAVMSLGWM
jgi:structural maintenance of chromosome 2